MFKDKIIFLFLITISISLPFDDDDWGWGDDEDDSLSQVSATTKPKLKRWTKQGLCDHDPLTSLILKFILDIQGNMRDGDPSVGMPPLDPLQIPQLKNIALKGNKHDYTLRANLSNIIVKDLSDFNITNIETDISDLYINVSVLINHMTIIGDYKLVGKGSMGLITLPIFGNGQFILQPKNALCEIFTKFGFDQNGTIWLEEFDFNLDLKDLKVDLTGFMGLGRRINKIFSKITNSIGLKIFNKMEPRIHEKVRSRGITEVNRILTELEYNEEMMQEMLDQSLRCLFG